MDGTSLTQEEHQSSDRIRVLIANEVRVVRDGLALLLRRSPGITIVDRPSQEIWYEEKQEGSTVDVVLAVSGSLANPAAEEIQRIRNRFPDAKVVIIGVFGTGNENLEFIEAGASGYVLPDSRVEKLIENLGGVPPNKRHCVELAIKALHNGFTVWDKNNSIKSVEEK